MNKYLETGTVFRKGDSLNAAGNDVTHAVRKAIADHRRILQGPHGNMAGKRVTYLADGTTITTWVNPYGLAPTLVAQVYTPQIETSADTVGVLVVDHGWLTGTIPDWIVYTWPSLAAYLASQGVTTGNSGEYTTQIPTRPIPIDTPNLYSGLARLLVQSLVGAGRALFEILPVDWTASPFSIGCIRSPDGTYWLTKADSGGVYAARLKTPAIAVSILEDAESGLLSGLDQDCADAIVLGAQELDAESDIIELVAAADTTLAAAYADGRSHWAWGWAWRYQARGATDEYQSGATIVTLRQTGSADTWRIQSGIRTLDITWDVDGVPAGAVSTETETEWSTADTGSRILAGTTAQVCWGLIQPLAAISAVATEGDLVSWYDVTGIRQTVHWSGNEGAGSGGIGYSAWNIRVGDVKTCGEGADQDQDYVSKTWTHTAYWTVGGHVLSTENLDSYIQESAVLTATGGTVADFGYSSNPSFFAQCAGGDLLDYYYTGDPSTWYSSLGPNVGWTNSGVVDRTGSGDTRSYSAVMQHVLIAESPGVVWVVKNGKRLTGEHREYAGGSTKVVTYGGLTNGVIGYNTYSAASISPVTTTTTLEEGTEHAGLLVADRESYPLSGDDLNLIAAACTYPTVSTPCGDNGVASFNGYYQHCLITGAPIPAGFDPVGATTAGRWVGAA